MKNTTIEHSERLVTLVYTGEKSILTVFEEILLKSCLEHSKLQKDKTKVTEGGGKPLQYQARG